MTTPRLVAGIPFVAAESALSLPDGELWPWLLDRMERTEFSLRVASFIIDASP